MTEKKVAPAKPTKPATMEDLMKSMMSAAEIRRKRRGTPTPVKMPPAAKMPMREY